MKKKQDFIESKSREFAVLAAVLQKVSVLPDVIAVCLGEQCANICRNITCSLQGQADRLLAPLASEDGGIMILKDIRNHLPDDSVSYSTMLYYTVVISTENTVTKLISVGSMLACCPSAHDMYTQNVLEVAMIRMCSCFV